MKRQIKQLMVVLVLAILANVMLLPRPDVIQEDKNRWKKFYDTTLPAAVAHKWYAPFLTSDRTDLNTIRVISTFGAKRLSYVRGHIHTGADLVPRRRSGGKINVFPMAKGVVCSIHLGDPHRTIVIKHKLPDGSLIYTSYKHLQSILVENGQQVTHETLLGRLYTSGEAKKQGGNYDHLHLEIRKRFDDYGVASWATMTKTDLDRRFYDPWIFMKKRIGI